MGVYCVIYSFDYYLQFICGDAIVIVYFYISKFVYRIVCRILLNVLDKYIQQK